MQPITVECTIRRKNGSLIEMPPSRMNPNGKNYKFKPADKDDPYSPHVADVADGQHLAMLLKVSESFRIVEAADEAPARGTGGGEAGGGAPTADPQTTQAPDDGFPEDIEDVRAMFTAVIGRAPSARAHRDTMIDQIKQAQQAALPPA